MLDILYNDQTLTLHRNFHFVTSKISLHKFVLIQTLSLFLLQEHTPRVKQTNTICNRWIFCGALVVVLILPALPGNQRIMT